MNLTVCGRKPSQPVSRRDVSSIGADDRSRSNEMLDHESRSASSRFECETSQLRNGIGSDQRPRNQLFHDVSRYLLGTSDADPKRKDSKTRSASKRTAPTAHSITCLALSAMPRLTRFTRGILQRKTPFDPRPVHMGYVMQKVALGHPSCRCQHQLSDAPHSFFPLSPTPYNLTNEERR